MNVKLVTVLLTEQISYIKQISCIHLLFVFLNMGKYLLTIDINFNLTNPVYQWFEITAVKARKNLEKQIYRFKKLIVHARLN